jgi:hypothetical protein
MNYFSKRGKIYSFRQKLLSKRRNRSRVKSEIKLSDAIHPSKLQLETLTVIGSILIPQSSKLIQESNTARIDREYSFAFFE